MKRHYRKLLALFLTLGAFVSSKQASAYTADITWVGPGTGFIQFYFIIEGTAMDGKGLLEKKAEKHVDNSHKLITYNHAGSLTGPIDIPAGWTVHFNFDGINIGKCFDMAQMKFGTKKDASGKGIDYPFQHLPIKAVDDNFYDKLSGALSNFGTGVSSAGQSVGEIKDPEGIGAAVGAATSGVGSIISGVGSLVKVSSCKNWSALVTFNDKGSITAYSPNF